MACARSEQKDADSSVCVERVPLGLTEIADQAARHVSGHDGPPEEVSLLRTVLSGPRRRTALPATRTTSP